MAKWLDEIKQRWQHAQPKPRQECVDINELATLSDEMPKLIAAVEVAEKALAQAYSDVVGYWGGEQEGYDTKVKIGEAIDRLQSGEFKEADEE